MVQGRKGESCQLLKYIFYAEEKRHYLAEYKGITDLRDESRTYAIIVYVRDFLIWLGILDYRE